MKALVVCLLLVSALRLHAQPFAAPPVAVHAHAGIDFVPNKGQWESEFLYKASLRNCNVYLEPDGIRYQLSHPANAGALHHYLNNRTGNAPVLKFHSYRMTLVNANAQPVSWGNDEKQHYFNYFIGSNPERWKGGVHPFESVRYQNVYNGIGLYAGSDNGRFVYDFIVQPHADPDQIQLRFDSVTNLHVRDGQLVIGTTIDEVVEMAPYVYQDINGKRVEVPCRYDVKGNTVRYVFPNGYDRNHVLVIDPTVVFATFTGSTADNWGCTATFDPQGNFYAGGNAFDFGYPTLGAVQAAFAGVGNQNVAQNNTNSYTSYCDVSITKFNPTGTQMIYSTYLGGSLEERPHSMIVDANGALLVTGHTDSWNFPVTGNAYQTANAGAFDIFVTKFNAAGDALVGSTFLGGSNNDGENTQSFPLYYNYGDNLRGEITVDESANVYVAACTWSTNFPVTDSVTQNVLKGQQDAVVFKMDPSLSTLLWSTYLGGNGYDAAYNITLADAGASVFVSGGTTGSGFPVTGGAYQTAFGGGSVDGFVAKFQNSGNYDLQKATYVGVWDYDQCFGLQVDWNNNVYITGQTIGGAFPVSAGVYANPGSSQFLMKLDNDLGGSLFSTVYGSGDSWQSDICPTAFMIDTCGSIYISGWGGPLGGQSTTSTFGLPVTADAFKSVTDGEDFYFIVFTQNAQALLYATFMGQDFGGGEHVDGGTSRFNKDGEIYQAICGGCGGTGFPTTPNVWAATNGTIGAMVPPNCNEVALKIAFQLVGAFADAFLDDEADTTGCAPLEVQFVNSSSNATSYLWDFGDGSSTTNAFSPSHTFTNAGTYTVKLIAFNDSVCVSSDTSFLTIHVYTQHVELGNDTAMCGTDTLILSPDVQPNSTFQWHDGSTASSFTVATSGQYAVTVVSNGCVATDVIDVSYTPWPSLSVSNDTVVCNDLALVINAISDADNFLWSTGATTQNITVNESGSYIVTASNGSCAVKDTVNILYKPFQQVNLGSDHMLCEGKQVALTVGFENPPYLWSTGETTQQIVVQAPGSWWVACGLGDCFTADTVAYEEVPNPTVDLPEDTAICAGDTVRLFAGDNPMYTYRWSTGEYTNAIVVTNPPQNIWVEAKLGNCYAGDEIFIDLDPCYCIYVPNAFSPNGDDRNDRFNVIHCPLDYYRMDLYNRWGEKVFTSFDPDEGWDGVYKGLAQPIGAYVYCIEAVVSKDKEKKLLKGNVTLLR